MIAEDQLYNLLFDWLHFVLSSLLMFEYEGLKMPCHRYSMKWNTVKILIPKMNKIFILLITNISVAQNWIVRPALRHPLSIACVNAVLFKKASQQSSVVPSIVIGDAVFIDNVDSVSDPVELLYENVVVAVVGRVVISFWMLIFKYL